MAQHKKTFGGVWAFPDGISARATGIHDVVGAAMLGAPMRAGLPYLAANPIVGAAMIAASWLIAAEVEPRIRLLLDHTLFRYRLKAA